MKIFKTILTGWLPSMMSSLWAAMVLPRYLHYFAMVGDGGGKGTERFRLWASHHAAMVLPH